MPELDMTGVPTQECICGCDTFITAVRFDNYRISWYALQGKCYACGNNVTLPCELDRLEPAELTLTCPLCDDDTNTVIVQEDDPILARCQSCCYYYVAA